jgi:hypothetical protein
MKAGMDRFTLKLEVSTLRAIVRLCRITGDSLRSTFEDECMGQRDRRAIFARWSQARRISFEAQEALDALPTI